ncbi:hypothetical protein [Mesorhizobium sp. J428]|uniref:hypothetical protein n=1 Tax=Mesorhizobium sp. J428 TaxID=2898440 RepID=UPI0021518902|nr:hypothetical protein [Mesorhizobium sp. J428]MCR5856898.1 hypothetical protein [Mesorhizobium sp. J428]
MQPLFEAIDWSVAATVVTAAATAALVWATIVLARYTKQMADNASSPHIVATVEPNAWSIIHFDVRVANTGAAVAYDVSVDFVPPLPTDPEKHRRGTPLRKISVLRPGQELHGYLGNYAFLDGKSFTVTTSWRRKPMGARESNKYVFDIGDYDSVIMLNGGHPLYAMAKDLKNLRNDWRRIAQGSKRMRVDGYDRVDRAQERARLDEMFDQQDLERSESNTDKSG